jgi:hypothetical protein
MAYSWNMIWELSTTLTHGTNRFKTLGNCGGKRLQNCYKEWKRTIQLKYTQKYFERDFHFRIFWGALACFSIFSCYRAVSDQWIMISVFLSVIFYTFRGSFLHKHWNLVGKKIAYYAKILPMFLELGNFIFYILSKYLEINITLWLFSFLLFNIFLLKS